MHSNSTSKLLDLKDCYVKKIIHGDTSTTFLITTKAKLSKCPCCGKETKKIHDYRDQKIKVIPSCSKTLTWF